MNIALIEPFFGGSHKKWCEGLQSHSAHNIVIFSLSAHHWKWRMHAAAITLANELINHDLDFDLIVASDFLDVALFQSLLPRSYQAPIALYFHENQISYPWSPTDPDIKLQRNNTYGFINYTSALVADQVYFNSDYHLKSFLGALPDFLKQFPDHRNIGTVDLIRHKSEVLPLGIDYEVFDRTKPTNHQYNKYPTILWNHRWEYDKNPEDFFDALYSLKKLNIDFRLIVLGQQLRNSPDIFEEAKIHLADEIIHWGYCESQDEYARWLWKADIIPVTSNQDFFGISVVEAMYCNAWPLLPKRLAYGEHWVKDADQYEFECMTELIEKLIWCCENIQVVRQQNISDVLVDYSWKRLIPFYDEKFNELISNSHDDNTVILVVPQILSYPHTTAEMEDGV